MAIIPQAVIHRTSTGVPIRPPLRSTTTTSRTGGAAGEKFLRPTPFVPPKVDVGRINLLTQQFGGAGVRRLRQALTRGLAKASQARNPATRRLLMRGAIEGFGAGVSDVTGRARAGAISAVQPEFQAATSSARLAFLERGLRERQERGFEETRAITEEAQPFTHTVARLPFGGRMDFEETAPLGQPGAFADTSIQRSGAGGGSTDFIRTVSEALRGGV